MLEKLRGVFSGFLNFLARHMLKLGISPNAVTVLSLLISLVAAFIYFVAVDAPWLYWVGAAILLLAGLLDALDGAMARLSNSVTKFGSFLDSLIDRYSDAIIIVAIGVSAPTRQILFGVNAATWASIALLGSIIVSYARAKAESLGIQMSGIGIAERPERITILVISSLFFNPFYGLVAIAFLANLTVIQRGVHVYRRLSRKDEGHGR